MEKTQRTPSERTFNFIQFICVLSETITLQKLRKDCREDSLVSAAEVIGWIYLEVVGCVCGGVGYGGAIVAARDDQATVRVSGGVIYREM